MTLLYNIVQILVNANYLQNTISFLPIYFAALRDDTRESYKLYTVILYTLMSAHNSVLDFVYIHTGRVKNVIILYVYPYGRINRSIENESKINISSALNPFSEFVPTRRYMLEWPYGINEV